MKRIFVGGIHGVGKTTFCEKLIDRFNDFQYLKASKLIENKKRASVADIYKNVHDMQLNQSILIEAVAEYVKANNRFILDGHFTLIEDGNVRTISKNVFSAMSLDLIFVLKAPANSIQKSRMSRDGTNPSLLLIEENQEKELEHSAFIASELDIRRIILTRDDIDIENIKDILNLVSE